MTDKQMYQVKKKLPSCCCYCCTSREHQKKKSKKLKSEENFSKAVWACFFSFFIALSRSTLFFLIFTFVGCKNKRVKFYQWYTKKNDSEKIEKNEGVRKASGRNRGFLIKKNAEICYSSISSFPIIIHQLRSTNDFHFSHAYECFRYLWRKIEVDCVKNYYYMEDNVKWRQWDACYFYENCKWDVPLHKYFQWLFNECHVCQ